MRSYYSKTSRPRKGAYCFILGQASESAIKNFPGRRIRTDMPDGDRDWENDFYILRKSWCPAVLTENFFMDSHSDLEYLQSRAGKQAIIDTHVEGIIEYLNQ